MIFKIGLIVMAVACILSLVWSSARSNVSKPDRTVSQHQGQPETGFTSQLPDPIRFSETEEVRKQQVLKQLDRHARYKSSGYYTVLSDEDAPPELKQRIQQEYDRLQALSSEHRESDSTESLETADAVSVQIDKQGQLSDELTLTFDLMVNYGRWDEFNQNHIGELRRQMTDSTIPERQRPTPDDVKRAQDSALVPYF